MTKRYVIFSVDNASNLHHLAKAIRYLDTIQAMNKGVNIILCHGAYKGSLEASFMCTREVFDTYVKGCHFVANQESFLFFEEGHRGRMYGTIETLGGELLSSGHIREVSKADAQSYEGWTYRPDLDKYWVLQ